MTIDIKELSGVVSELNRLFYDQSEGEAFSGSPFEIKTNGDEQVVNFLGLGLWDSEDDERETDKDEIYEPIRDYLVREFNEHMESFGNIRIK